MTKKISQYNQDASIDYKTEYLRIETLYSMNKTVGTYGHISRQAANFTFEDYIDQCVFNTWIIRGRYISIGDMREGLGISKEIMQKEFNTERFVIYLQYVANATKRISETIDKYSNLYITDDTILTVIVSNIKEILDKMNFNIFLDDNGELFVTEKNPYADIVAKKMPDLSESINEYIRIKVKGDLKRKSEILCTIWKQYEPYRQILNRNNLSSLESDISFLFNKINVRHNNIEGKQANKLVESMSEIETEKWYDKAFELYLLAMLHINYFNFKDELNLLKTKITEKSE